MTERCVAVIFVMIGNQPIIAGGGQDYRRPPRQSQVRLTHNRTGAVYPLAARLDTLTLCVEFSGIGAGEIERGAPMQAECVVEFWHATQKLGLEICIEGGWAVDAVLGRQTRPHNDLDIALPATDVAALRQLLSARDYVEVYRPDSWEHNFVLEDPQGRLIDVHSYILNPDGSNAGGVSYVADHVSGSGVILGTPVRCVPPHWLIQSHTGYEIRDSDWHDVRLLCRELNLAIPPGFEALAEPDTTKGNPRTSLS